MNADSLIAIKNAVKEVFTAEAGAKLYVNLERVPLLCQNVMGMQDMLKEQRDDIKEIKETIQTQEERFVTQKEFTLIRNIIYGGIAIILTGLLVLVLAKVAPGFRLS